MNDDPLFSMEQNIKSYELDPDTDTTSIKVVYLQNKKKSPKKNKKRQGSTKYSKINSFKIFASLFLSAGILFYISGRSTSKSRSRVPSLMYICMYHTTSAKFHANFLLKATFYSRATCLYICCLFFILVMCSCFLGHCMKLQLLRMLTLLQPNAPHSLKLLKKKTKKMIDMTFTFQFACSPQRVQIMFNTYS